MSPRFSYRRLAALTLAITCICAALALAVRVAPAEATRDASGLILLQIEEEGGQMPPVVFDHNLHTGEDQTGATCISCHDPTLPVGSFSEANGKSGKDLENAFHDGCLSCHEDAKAAGQRPAPPQKAECRSCHTGQPVAANAPRTDGGMSPAVHATHVASDVIVPPAIPVNPLLMGLGENCTACHHPDGRTTNPGLRADSCRSCHESGNGVPDSGAPPFAQIAHDRCISCHLSLAPAVEGKTLPVSCNSCHGEKLAANAPSSPLPRLDAGQPDLLLLGVPPSPDKSSMPTPPPPLQGAVPDPYLDAATRPIPSMPPVLFDHKAHEAQAESCTSCHHNTMANCSSCHTPTGSPKGKNIPLANAMHLPDSDRSCVGCHESRKLASPECAGCHTIMPVKASPSQCGTCHDPANSRLLPNGAPGGGAPPPGKVPADPWRKAVAEAPETVRIDALTSEYEPVVLPHRQIIDSLAEGLAAKSPGMRVFHADPYSLCASCHHNTPMSATPPSCASCHAASAPAAATAGKRPLLKAAYHQQCMTCHEAMAITKPANTDCASCHAPRAAVR